MSKNQSLGLRARFEEFILFQKTQGTFQSRNGKIHDRLGFMISRQREELFPKIGIVGSFDLYTSEQFVVEIPKQFDSC